MRTLALRITVPAVIALLTGCTQSKPSADDAKKFQQYDANGDGFISANEALRAAPSSGRK